MPFPRSKLDAYLVFLDSSLSGDSLFSQFNQWRLKGRVSEDGSGAVNDSAFGFGSFHKLEIIDLDRSRLFANHQGGYRVYCPNNDKIVTVDFIAGVAEWRACQNDPKETIVLCSACNRHHALVDFVGRPTFAFGKCAFHFSNISSVDLNSVVVEEIERNIGRFSLVFKRVG